MMQIGNNARQILIIVAIGGEVSKPSTPFTIIGYAGGSGRAEGKMLGPGQENYDKYAGTLCKSQKIQAIVKKTER